MRGTIVTAVAVTALAIPGAAVASRQSEHEGPHDQGIHHKRHHARRHSRSHVVTFGAAASSTPATSTGASAPAPPVGGGDEIAGTVASFSGGTLTLELSDGSAVSGKVDASTEIECRATAATAARDGERGDGDDGRDDDAQDEAEHCSSAALVAGAVVREAELRVSSAGAVWERVELGQ